MNSVMMWRAVDPSPEEVHAARLAFEGLDVSDILPRLVMVRRAVTAHFYTDTCQSTPGVVAAPVMDGTVDHALA